MWSLRSLFLKYEVLAHFSVFGKYELIQGQKVRACNDPGRILLI